MKPFETGESKKEVRVRTSKRARTKQSQLQNDNSMTDNNLQPCKVYNEAKTKPVTQRLPKGCFARADPQRHIRRAREPFPAISSEIDCYRSYVPTHSDCAMTWPSMAARSDFLSAPGARLSAESKA